MTSMTYLNDLIRSLSPLGFLSHLKHSLYYPQDGITLCHCSHKARRQNTKAEDEDGSATPQVRYLIVLPSFK